MNAFKNPIPSVVAVLLATLVFPACTKKETAAVPSPTPVTSEVLTTAGKALAKTQSSEIAFNLYRFLAADPKNVSLSPLSLEQAFSMVYLGTNGKTKSQLEELFGFKNNEVYSLQNEKLPEGIEFHWGNSVWSKPGKTLSPSYLETLREKLGATASSTLDLGKINAWVAKETHDHIKDLIKQLDLRTIVVLVNALYLNAPWEEPFRKEQDLFGPFQSSPHQASQVTFLNRKSTMRYHETATGKWVELPYRGGTLSMILGLPKKKFDLRSLEEALSSTLVEEVSKGFRDEYVDFKLPKFKMETSLSLSSVFSSLGYSELFSKGDYSRMTLQPDVRITEILQATYLRVDEQGTEAAAATAVAMKGTGAPLFDQPKTFYANEPFLFLIRNQKTGRLYFLGRVYDPKI
jgi:serpin B